MNHLADHNNELRYDTRFDDIMDIERQARVMRARVVAEGIRRGWAWVVARLRRTPVGQAA